MTESKDPKDYLMQIRILDIKIDSMLDTLDNLRASVLRITPVLKQDVVSGGSAPDRMSSTMAKIVDLQNEINQTIDRYVDEKANIIRLLDQIHIPDYLQVLQKRYIEYQTFEEIAADMHYSYRWICKLHGRALQAFGRLLNQEEEQEE